MFIDGRSNSDMFGQLFLFTTASIIIWISLFINSSIIAAPFLARCNREYACVSDKWVLLLSVWLLVCWWQKAGRSLHFGVQKENVRLSCKLMAKCFFSSQKIERCKEWEWSRGELLADFLGGWKCPLTALGRANNSTRVSTWDLQVEGTFQKYLCAPSGCLCSPVATFAFCGHLWCRREGRTSTEDVVWLWSAFIVHIVCFC